MALYSDRRYNHAMAGQDNYSALVKRVRAGDNQAFVQLYDQLSQPLMRFMLLKTHDLDLAEDICAIAWQKAWQGLTNGKFRNKNFKAWLFTVAYHQLIDHYRRQHPTADLSQIEPASSNSHDYPEQQFLKQEQQRQLYQAINQLNQRDRQIIWLRFVEGFNIKQTSQITGLNSLKIRVYQHRALKKLKQILKHD